MALSMQASHDFACVCAIVSFKLPLSTGCFVCGDSLCVHALLYTVSLVNAVRPLSAFGSLFAFPRTVLLANASHTPVSPPITSFFNVP